jgi:hypothetical protein
MDDKPMLNAPIETGMTAGEEFEKNVLGRMNRAHEAFVDVNRTLDEPPEQVQERAERFREEAIAHIEAMTGKKFDRVTGQRIYSESEQAARREAEANADKRDTGITRKKR